MGLFRDCRGKEARAKMALPTVEMPSVQCTLTSNLHDAVPWQLMLWTVLLGTKAVGSFCLPLSSRHLARSSVRKRWDREDGR